MKGIVAISFAIICILGFTSCSNDSFLFKNGSYTNLDKAIKHSDKVEYLSLSDQNIRDFPLEILAMKNLRVLNLSRTNISIIPPEIDQLQQLEYLNLTGNSIQELPEELTRLKELNYLVLSYNNISEEEIKWLRIQMPNCKIVDAILL